MKNGGPIPWNAAAICELFRILDGKTPLKRRFGVPLNGPVIPIGAMVECHPISVTDLSRTTSIWSKSLARFFRRLCYCMRAESGKETLWS